MSSIASLRLGALIIIELRDACLHKVGTLDSYTQFKKIEYPDKQGVRSMSFNACIG